jgi:hypothetical protein
MKKYFKYYICGEHMLRALTKEIAKKKFEKIGLDTKELRYTIDYKKAIRIANNQGGVIYGKHS